MEKYKNKEFLIQKLKVEKLSYNQLAVQLGCGVSTLRYWIKKHGIELRGNLQKELLKNKRKITEMYIQQNKTLKEIGEAFNCSQQTVLNFINAEGIYKDINRWQRWEEEEVRDLIRLRNEGKKLGEIYQFFKGKYNENKISHKLNSLGFFREEVWSEDEERMLKECDGLSMNEILPLFPHKDYSQILYKAGALKVDIRLMNRPWSENERQVLINNPDKTLDELAAMLDRSSNAIWTKIKEEKLTFKKKVVMASDIIDNKITCPKCGELKEYTEENFNLNINYYTCINCRNKITNITKYRLKYGITLDFEKMFNTFTAIEWYHMYLDGRISKLPQEIYDSHVKRNEIIVHIIKELLKKESREDIIELNYNDIRRYKITYFLLGNNICDILNDVFSEYNFKHWEFRLVPGDFWSEKQHADEYLRWFVETRLNINELNINRDIPKIFTVSSLRIIGEHRLNRCLHEYDHYGSYYEWLSYIFPQWGLQPENFKLSISFDGVVFDSNEECLIYEYLKRECGISITYVGNQRFYKFWNEEHNESYIPDFVISKINNIKLDKPLIMEYYGLYNPNLTDSFFQDYCEKTCRKNAFYKQNGDIYFLDIYPYDLVSTFKGVSEKLNAFNKQEINRER
ncbi:hypothetical protein MKY09_05325 [Psychrobacillus sp. FSL K6-4046]|uniref:hypothetical protein n=1 Tax=Psychrobacillus sp. FSL K6-4046 TaxID=2921550 RepID=UPI00315AEFF5